MRRTTRRLLYTLGLAAITGSRTSLGPALVRARRRPRPGRLALAALELFADKVPRMPARTAPIGLAFRIVSAASVVRAMLKRRGRAVGVGALALGAAAAVAGAFGGLRLRLALTRLLGGGAIANAVSGTIEDVALIAAGRRLARVR